MLIYFTGEEYVLKYRIYWLKSCLLTPITDMKMQALRQFLRNQSRAQIPGTLYAIMIKHQQIKEREKRRVGTPLTGMN
jgi:hypothetical protein